MASKKPSSTEYKKRRKLKNEIQQNCTLQLQDWLGRGSTSRDLTFVARRKDLAENTGENVIVKVLSEKTTHVLNEENHAPKIFESEEERETSTNSINFNDPPSWPPISDKIKFLLIEHGPEQGLDADFRESTSQDGRKFGKEWFSKKCANREVIHRNWLIYSKISLSLFCFPCILFTKIRTESMITNAKKGYKDWKNLNRISDHENSMFHRDAYVQWKCFEKKIRSGGFIDDSLQKSIQSEKEKWRNIFVPYWT